MDNTFMNSKRVNTIIILAILFSAAFAIIIHAILPASVNGDQFNSILVKWFGFPAVSIFYFILLFTHCALSVRYIGLRTVASKLQIGIRFGIAYAMIYIFGMQEIVVEYSPFLSWDFEFVRYQFLIGIGDGIPALLLCLIISYFTLENNSQIKTLPQLQFMKDIKVITIIAITFFIERTIFYQTGIINSECVSYPVPCYAWTGMFGVLLGYIYIILYPLLSYDDSNCQHGGRAKKYCQGHHTREDTPDINRTFRTNKKHQCPGKRKNKSPTDIGRFNIICLHILHQDAPKSDKFLHFFPPPFSFSFFILFISIPVTLTKTSSREGRIIFASRTSWSFPSKNFIKGIKSIFSGELILIRK